MIEDEGYTIRALSDRLDLHLQGVGRLLTRQEVFYGHRARDYAEEAPLHDRDILVTACGRICMYRKKINISTVKAGQRPGIKKVEDGIWIVSFMQYDLGYISLERKTLQPIDNPFVTGV